MTVKRPEGTQRVVPYLVYRDCPAAIEFLTQAFGFTERLRYAMDDGAIGHAELAVDEDTVVYVATACDPLGHGTPEESGVRQGLVCVYVEDCDALFEQARDAGATVVSEPEDQFYGDRTFRVLDPEGYEWNIAQHVRDFDPNQPAA